MTIHGQRRLWGLPAMQSVDLLTYPRAQSRTAGQVYDQGLRWYDTALKDYYGNSDFWNWGYWESDTKNQREACVNLMERLLSLIPNKRGRILDVACGLGATTAHLLTYYPPAEVVGINLGDKQLQICRQKNLGCEFLKMDATNLEFADNSFNALICVEAAFHFNTREKFLCEAFRVLKPGGKLVLSDILMTPEAPNHLPENVANTPSDYEKILLRAGFAHAEIVDATEECWHGFYRYNHRYNRTQLAAGMISLRAYRWLVARLLSTAQFVKYYVLAAANKKK